MSHDGGCLCGHIRYRIERRHLNAMHCYCGMCRKAHGTAFSTHLVARPEQVQWLNDHSRQVYESSADAYREFCPHCGTHILVHGQSGDGTLAIPAGTLDEDVPVTILGHMFTADRVGWFEISDALPQFEGWPDGYGPGS